MYSSQIICILISSILISSLSSEHTWRREGGHHGSHFRWGWFATGLSQNDDCKALFPRTEFLLGRQQPRHAHKEVQKEQSQARRKRVTSCSSRDLTFLFWGNQKLKGMRYYKLTTGHLPRDINPFAPCRRSSHRLKFVPRFTTQECQLSSPHFPILCPCYLKKDAICSSCLPRKLIKNQA